MMSEILQIRELKKYFGGTKAVDDFSADIQAGSITGLIGPNGSGKTTVFNLITGFLKPDSGSVYFTNSSLPTTHYPLHNKKPHHIARMGIGRTFQDMRLIHRLTVLDNLLLGFQQNLGESVAGALIGWGNSTDRKNAFRAEKIMEFVGLTGVRYHLASDISYGQQKLLSLGVALSLSPTLLLLDEPFSGVSPAMVEKIISLLRALTGKENSPHYPLPTTHCTVFLIDHDLEAVKNVCDEVIVMDEGKKIVQGPPSVIREDPRVMEAYFT